jgi:hypothetical protein
MTAAYRWLYRSGRDTALATAPRRVEDEDVAAITPQVYGAAVLSGVSTLGVAGAAGVLSVVVVAA